MSQVQQEGPESEAVAFGSLTVRGSCRDGLIPSLSRKPFRFQRTISFFFFLCIFIWEIIWTLSFEAFMTLKYHMCIQKKHVYLK